MEISTMRNGTVAAVPAGAVSADRLVVIMSESDNAPARLMPLARAHIVGQHRTLVES
jgi:hypothetical protein